MKTIKLYFAFFIAAFGGLSAQDLVRKKTGSEGNYLYFWDVDGCNKKDKFREVYTDFGLKLNRKQLNNAFIAGKGCQDECKISVDKNGVAWLVYNNLKFIVDFLNPSWIDEKKKDDQGFEEHNKLIEVKDLLSNDDIPHEIEKEKKWNFSQQTLVVCLLHCLEKAVLDRQKIDELEKIVKTLMDDFVRYENLLNHSLEKGKAVVICEMEEHVTKLKDLLDGQEVDLDYKSLLFEHEKQNLHREIELKSKLVERVLEELKKLSSTAIELVSKNSLDKTNLEEIFTKYIEFVSEIQDRLALAAVPYASFESIDELLKSESFSKSICLSESGSPRIPLLSLSGSDSSGGSKKSVNSVDASTSTTIAEYVTLNNDDDSSDVDLG